MADQPDDSERSEEPTERRLSEARQKGQVILSREVSSLLLVGMGALLSATALPWATTISSGHLTRLLARADRARLDSASIEPLVGSSLLGATWPFVLLLAAFTVAALAGPVLQGAVVWTSQPLAPKLERISPLAGAKRLFSAHALIELLKSLAKVLLVGGATGAVVWSYREEVAGLAAVELGAAMLSLGRIVVAVLAAATVAISAIAIIDWAHQRARFMRQLRMTKQELKEETKQSDGDPFIKQRLRGIRMERARHRMMAEVPKSTVVVTNPTHVAVALRYVEGMAAPVVTAKGYDHVAQAIKQLAKEHGIPLVENVALARALVVTAEPGKPIPVDHYQAVAEVIAYLLRLDRQRRGAGAAAPLRG
jgi:flagellar biosynthesis protein FlhB